MNFKSYINRLTESSSIDFKEGKVYYIHVDDQLFTQPVREADELMEKLWSDTNLVYKNSEEVLKLCLKHIETQGNTFLIPDDLNHTIMHFVHQFNKIKHLQGIWMLFDGNCMKLRDMSEDFYVGVKYERLEMVKKVLQTNDEEDISNW